MWRLNGNDILSTNTACHYLVNKKHKEYDGDGKEFSWLWKLIIPNKIKFFLWVLYHDKFSSNHNLSKMGLNVNPNCHTCVQSIVNTNHLFFECPHITNFWREMLDKARKFTIFTLSSFSLKTRTPLGNPQSTRLITLLFSGLNFYHTVFGQYGRSETKMSSTRITISLLLPKPMLKLWNSAT